LAIVLDTYLFFTNFLFFTFLPAYFLLTMNFNTLNFSRTNSQSDLFIGFFFHQLTCSSSKEESVINFF